MIIKTEQTLVFEYPEDYQAEIEWNKKRDGDWVHQSTDTICSVYTITNRYLIPTKAKHSFVDNPYFEVEPQKWYKDEPQTDIHDLTDCDFCKDRNCKDCEGGKDEPQTDGYMTAEQTEDYRKMLDKAEHKVYGNIEDEPQDCLTCRYNSDEWDSPKCDGCTKAHSNYEPQTDIG